MESREHKEGIGLHGHTNEPEPKQRIAPEAREEQAKPPAPRRRTKRE